MARKKRKVPQVNSSSSADIAFLLLIFFLITTSMDTDKGLLRKLPPPIPPDQEQQDLDIKKRNTLQVMINSFGQVAVNGEQIDVKNLRERAKEFIANKEDLPNLPERFPTDVEFFGTYPVTKFHVISLQNDRQTEYQAYIEVQNELVAAYNELREELSKAKFNKSFADLSEPEQKAVQAIYPQKISEAEPKVYGGKK
ncbi:MAG: biopolymer transporter ExbD [Bacteroidales bacterium]|nr:biopolymer transporter ExbD [Bacteroidales bacterium]